MADVLIRPTVCDEGEGEGDEGKRGKRGHHGQTGPTGPAGSSSSKGTTGPTGPIGPTGSGSTGPTGATSPTAGPVMINYIATGIEGTDFNVPIGQTLANTTYGVTWAPAGVSNVPVLDLPNRIASDRTVTQFRVQLATSFTAGDRIAFFVFPN